ncbi:DUF397 domain-containing protein [Streptomyces sp. NPDC050400]|uniref:DUF397 domain-containing protein n=1 Tax=Streptomyces sp. NPDC050400 TaxID=3365610 RepID=UPI0037876362
MNTAARPLDGPPSNLAWFTSSYSSDQGGNCVEVATHPAAVHIRDSKNDPATGAVLTVSPGTWAAFLRTAT